MLLRLSDLNPDINIIPSPLHRVEISYDE